MNPTVEILLLLQLSVGRGKYSTVFKTNKNIRYSFLKEKTNQEMDRLA